MGSKHDRDLVMEEKRLLKCMHSTVEAETTRLTKLIRKSQGASEKSKELWKRIEQRFNKHLLKLTSTLDLLHNSLEKEDLSGQELDKAWQRFGEIRSELLPPLANDVLAAIGGLYLRENYLDDAGSLLDGRKGKDPISFSGLAEALVSTDLRKRTGSEGYPVLIVAEERLDDVSDAVIRLRFPACDLWSLPLTAHEYGYLLTRKREEFLLKFEELRKEVRNEAESPAKGPDSSQERRLCRIFADAFATLFGGPAYLFALLHLRFTPNELPSSEMPSFTQRFLSALTILQHMDEKPFVEPSEKYRNRFARAREVLEELKSIAWKVAHVDAEGAALSEQYMSWVDRIYDCFNVDVFKASIKETYDTWKEAEESGGAIAEVLMHGSKASRRPSQPPSIWLVLNAAWRLRIDPPKGGIDLESMSCNALSLLNENDSSLLRQEATSRPPPPSPIGRSGQVPLAPDADEKRQNILQQSPQISGNYERQIGEFVKSKGDREVDGDVKRPLAEGNAEIRERQQQELELLKAALRAVFPFVKQGG